MFLQYSKVMLFVYCRRLFEEHGTKTELYVCYQENMSQDCVEMAYRLLFGWTG